MKIAIVGSGHSGVSAAIQLVNNGIKPFILDPGEKLPTHRKKILEKLSTENYINWNIDHINSVSISKQLQKSNPPLKKSFGSDYFYAKCRAPIPTLQNDTNAFQSFAKGGFGSAWGTAILPYDDDDIKDWPINNKQLRPFYKQALEHIPLSGQLDGLDKHFPLYKKNLSSIKIDNVSKSLLSRLEKFNLNNIDRNFKFVFGQSRLAIDGSNCRYCGFCLNGCPYNIVHSPDKILDQLIREKKVIYKNKLILSTFREENDKVFLNLLNPNGSVYGVEIFDKVYIGAGALGTSRIILESFKKFNTDIELSDSEKFVIPFLNFSKPNFNWPNSNTFSSLFFETKFYKISNFWLHTQVSSINEIILNEIFCNSRFYYGPNILGKLFKPLVSRIMAAYCSMHSSLSSKLILRLDNPSNTTLKISSKRSQESIKAINNYSYELTKLGKKINCIFFPSFKRIWEPGSTGFLGGAFPMKTNPKKWNETDTLGRPFGSKNIHIVDSSIFPSIPGTTLALTIIANSKRIVTSSLNE